MGNGAHRGDPEGEQGSEPRGASRVLVVLLLGKQEDKWRVYTLEAQGLGGFPKELLEIPLKRSL